MSDTARTWGQGLGGRGGGGALPLKGECYQGWIGRRRHCLFKGECYWGWISGGGGHCLLKVSVTRDGSGGGGTASLKVSVTRDGSGSDVGGGALPF